jgi:hypothetical protein
MNKLRVPVRNRTLQRSVAISYWSIINMCTIVKKKLHDLCVTLVGCQPQSTTLVACFEDTFLNQQFNHLNVTPK